MSTDLFGVRVLDVDPTERRARFRVFAVYYDESWDLVDPLPADASFFFRVLWEAAAGRGGPRFGPLRDLVALDDFLDESWVDRHTHRFVERFTRVASRNTPLTADDLGRLATFHSARAGHWQDEDGLAQGDFDVWATDPRWLAPLRPGQSWGSTSYATTAEHPAPAGWRAEYADLAALDDAHAAFVHGWLLLDEGDARRAAEAFTTAARARHNGDDGDDGAHRAKSLAHLGDAHARLGEVERAREAYQRALAVRTAEWSGGDRHRARAALGLGALPHAAGDEAAARAALARARPLAGGDRGLLAEIRRRAGAETLVDRADRLLFAAAGRRPSAAELAAGFGSAALARFALAAYQRRFDEALAAVDALAAPPHADRERAAEFGLDLAADEEGVQDAALPLVLATGAVAPAYRRHLGRLLAEGAEAEEPIRRLAPALFGLLERSGGHHTADTLAEALTEAVPGVAATVFHALGMAAKDRDDTARAADWFARAADLPARPHTAASAAYNLGVTRSRQGRSGAAVHAFTRAEAGFLACDDAARAGKAARGLADLANRRGDQATAWSAWSRAAYQESRARLRKDARARQSLLALADLLTESGAEAAAAAAHRLAGDGDADRPAATASYRWCATFHFAHWIADQGHLALADTLLRKVADGTGSYAAKAALTLGAHAYAAEDATRARTWWQHTLAVGDERRRHEASLNLGQLAKRERDIDEALRWFAPIADSTHPD
ncbi:hypothetical protein E1283_34765, partial [Streptomyces hainanensis]